MLQTEFINVHKPDARGNILHEMIQVFLHLLEIIYVKKCVTGLHSGTGPEWALLWAERPQHVNLFPSTNKYCANGKIAWYLDSTHENTQTFIFQKLRA